jgi:hypothetical protein
MTYSVGDKIKFKSEKQKYRVMACDSRYLICVKHFNLKRTFIYTIVDLKENMRGPENLLFGPDYDLFDSADCELFLKDFQSGKVELSPRRSIPLDLEAV